MKARLYAQAQQKCARHIAVFQDRRVASRPQASMAVLERRDRWRSSEMARLDDPRGLFRYYREQL
jgi:hypothetical protein